MADDLEKARLKALEDRIEGLKKTQAPEPRGDEHYSQAQLAWRMVIELVAGLAIGFGIGYGLDWAFGTQPIFLVLFILLGFAAGVNVMMRTAKEVQAEQAAHAARKKD
ncbi:AtpZ/AtpI family protein [Litoreibacter roseus]|uniref:ATP synthase protein I n=1 Tax=Litoreibacter roseus TaxID=2601869 RepID=A0A6N6JIW0_9RHOB|nr:AtpZ/AtpI family protein [Litoreibacter roseus]GFE65218.1 ATP synthase protein I [Litoreibacter roseus]